MSIQENYQSILTLARAGSTDFALSEYVRLGLDKIRHNEDIMALHGRLYKDMYLSQSNEAARKSAQLSADRYEAAFKDSHGFYSGINAATMSLLAHFDEAMVSMRARRILDILPPPQLLDAQTKYFIEATRAEAYLLLSEVMKAEHAFRLAVDHDPLNYTAHASTLKQFQMIANYRDMHLEWLTQFDPPKTMHFTGHMFGIEESRDPDLPLLTHAQTETVKSSIIEAIQVNDIGFAYGALAAGADIMIAEAVLGEGAELHITLPVNEAVFMQASIAPFGAQWLPRFERCLSRAHCVKIVDKDADQLSHLLEQRASLASMAAAIRHANMLAVSSKQLLLWDQKHGATGTANDASLWSNIARPQILIDYPEPRKGSNQRRPADKATISYALINTQKDVIDNSDDLSLLLKNAVNYRKSTKPEAEFAIYCPEFDKDDVIDRVLQYAVPGAIMLTLSAADYVTLYHAEDYEACLINSFNKDIQIYALHLKG